MLDTFQVDMFPQFSGEHGSKFVVWDGQQSQVSRFNAISQKIVPLTNIEVAEDEYTILGCQKGPRT